MKKIIFYYFLLSLFSAILGFTYSYHLPQIKTWSKYQILKLSDRHLPAKILVKDFSLSLIPFGLAFDGIVINPKPPLTQSLFPIETKRVVAGINLLSLFTGSRHIVQLTIEEPDLTLILKSKPNKDLDKKFEAPLIPVTDILSIPLRNLDIVNAHIKFRSDDARILSEINNFNITADFTSKALAINLSTPEFAFKEQGSPSSLSLVQLESEFILEKEALQISTLKIQRNNSVFVATGLVEGNLEKGTYTKKNLKGRTTLNLSEFRKWVMDFRPNTKLPTLQGLFDATFTVSQINDSPIDADVIMNTQALEVKGIKIGQIQGQVKYSQNQASLEELKIQNKAVKARLLNTVIKEKEKYAFSTEVDVEHLEVGQLVSFITKKNIPIYLQAKTLLPCRGQLEDQIWIECSGTATGSKFYVFNEDNPKEKIIEVGDFRIDGVVRADEVGVYPRATLAIGDSKGTAYGSIKYKEGFLFNYEASQIYFKDLISLIGLKFEGEATLRGETKGNSDYATVNMDVKTSKFWFEDYGVGNAHGSVDYKSSKLSLRKLQGVFRNSKYQGDIQISLNEKTIKGNVKSDFVDLNDLQKGLERKAKLPFTAYGTGTGSVQFEGPLRFNQLTYNLKSSFQDGAIGHENYNRIYFNLHSKRGNVVTERVEVIKGPGNAILVAKAYPNGQINGEVIGKGFRLEDFQIINSGGIDITGQANFNMSLKGYILRPEITFVGKSTGVSLNKQLVADSNLDFSINQESIIGKGQLLGDVISGDFQIPLDNSTPFKLDIVTNKWNFTPLFGMISTSVKQQGYESELSSQVKLFSSRGGIKKSDGSIDITSLKVKKGTLALQNNEPISIHVNNGIVDIKRFRVTGDNTQIRVVSRPAPAGISIAQVSGNIDMTLLSFLTPFFQELRGSLALSTQLKLDQENGFGLAGSAFVERGYVRLKEFPHPFEQIKGDFLFNQDKVTVNSLSSSFAGGNLSANGWVEIKKYGDFPAFISVQLEDTTIKVPDGVSSRGSGTGQIRGNWFPYLLTGDYRISEGSMTKSLQTAETGLLKRSSYLPKSILEQVFDPLEFDLQTQIAGDYRVLNSLMDTLIRGELRIKGTPSSPTLLGEIRPVRGGQFFFRDTPFEITGGWVRFTNPNDINPLIYATAKTRVKTRETEASSARQTGTSSAPTSIAREYEVNIIVQGTQKDPRISLSSSPPLSDSDIVSLLALGVTTQELERRESSEQATDVGTAILSQNLALKNKYVDVKIQSSGTEDPNVADSKVVLSRQWSPKVSTSVGRTLRTNVTDAKLRYQLNDNLSAILNWEGRQIDEETKQTTKQSGDILGVGLEYGVEFK